MFLYIPSAPVIRESSSRTSPERLLQYCHTNVAEQKVNNHPVWPMVLVSQVVYVLDDMS